jgi:hypothetical protein
MARFIHLGHTKHIIKPLVHLALHQGRTHHLGMGYAGAQKKNIGSMTSIQGQGRKKLVPLRFKL